MDETVRRRGTLVNHIGHDELLNAELMRVLFLR